MAKEKDTTIDFEGAPPAQGRQFSHIKPGTYVMLVKAELTDTSTGKRAVSATFTVQKGAERGRKVGDLFVIPRKGTDDSPFGIQRLNALGVACGLKAQSKKIKASAIVKAISGKKIVAEVDDNEMPATDTRPATMTSRPTTYHKIGTDSAKEALSFAADGAAPKAAAEPEEEADGEDVEPEADEDTGDDGDDDTAEGGELAEDDAEDLFAEGEGDD
jgi:hypothetical protein